MSTSGDPVWPLNNRSMGNYTVFLKFEKMVWDRLEALMEGDKLLEHDYRSTPRRQKNLEARLGGHQ